MKWKTLFATKLCRWNGIECVTQFQQPQSHRRPNDYRLIESFRLHRAREKKETNLKEKPNKLKWFVSFLVFLRLLHLLSVGRLLSWKRSMLRFVSASLCTDFVQVKCEKFPAPNAKGGFKFDGKHESNANLAALFQRLNRVIEWMGKRNFAMFACMFAKRAYLFVPTCSIGRLLDSTPENVTKMKIDLARTNRFILFIFLLSCSASSSFDREKSLHNFISFSFAPPPINWVAIIKKSESNENGSVSHYQLFIQSVVRIVVRSSNHSAHILAKKSRKRRMAESKSRAKSIPKHWNRNVFQQEAMPFKLTQNVILQFVFNANAVL